MSRLLALFALMFAFNISANATVASFSIDHSASCVVMADEKKDDKKGEEEEAEPECD